MQLVKIASVLIVLMTVACAKSPQTPLIPAANPTKGKVSEQKPTDVIQPVDPQSDSAKLDNIQAEGSQAENAAKTTFADASTSDYVTVHKNFPFKNAFVEKICVGAFGPECTAHVDLFIAQYWNPGSMIDALHFSAAMLNNVCSLPQNYDEQKTCYSNSTHSYFGHLCVDATQLAFSQRNPANTNKITLDQKVLESVYAIDQRCSNFDLGHNQAKISAHIAGKNQDPTKDLRKLQSEFRPRFDAFSHGGSAFFAIPTW